VKDSKNRRENNRKNYAFDEGNSVFPVERRGKLGKRVSEAAWRAGGARADILRGPSSPGDKELFFGQAGCNGGDRARSFREEGRQERKMGLQGAFSGKPKTSRRKNIGEGQCPGEAEREKETSQVDHGSFLGKE